MGEQHTYGQSYALPPGKADFEYVMMSGGLAARQKLDAANPRLGSPEEHRTEAEAQRRALAQDAADRPEAAAGIRERLAILEAHDFPGAAPVERVKLLNKLRAVWHFPKRGAMIPVKYELIPEIAFSNRPASSIRNGNLLVMERTTGYPVGENKEMLLQNGEIAAVAAYTGPDGESLHTPFLAPEGQQLAGYSVLDPAEDFTPRGVIGVWDKSSLSLERYRSDYLRHAGGELDLVIGQFGLEAATAAIV